MIAIPQTLIVVTTASTDSDAASRRVVPSQDWAGCIARTAPAEGRLWLALGKPGKIKDSAAASRSANLAFRLKAGCANQLAPGQEVRDIAFDAKDVWGKLGVASLPLTTNVRREMRAALCTVSFIIDDVSVYVGRPEALPADVAAHVAMQIGGYDTLGASEPMVKLTSARQSDGKPVYLLRKCRLIAADGTLTDAQT